MSRENVELVRRMAEIWNLRRWRGVAGEGLLHPAVEYHDDPGWPESRSARGTDALIARFDEFEDAIAQDGRVEVERIEAAGDYVALVFRLTGTGTASQAPYTYSWGFLCRVRDGQIDYIQAYLDAKQALESVGLSE
jgi:ketosteroid isomerase-like protein